MSSTLVVAKHMYLAVFQVYLFLKIRFSEEVFFEVWVTVYSNMHVSAFRKKIANVAHFIIAIPPNSGIFQKKKRFF